VNQGKGTRKLGLTLAAVTTQVGCVTLLLTLGAILVGRWLDGWLGTDPVLTISLTLISLPVTLVSIFAIVRWTTSKMIDSQAEKQDQVSEEEDLG
jgi:F0F1-type ATP synthase assembly protein I